MTYSLDQTIFMLSMASNAVADIKATISGYQTELTGYMKVALSGGSLKDVANYGAFSKYTGDCPGYFPTNNSQLDGGDWEVVWGPCVYVAPRTAEDFALELYASNSMYVAYSKNLNTYVVAIAATDPANLEDWIQEDFDVYAEYTATWPPAIPFERTKHAVLPATTPQISAATATGISALLGMTDPKQGTLQAYLKSVANSEATLVFTGHSLAGALSPTLAFYLYPNSTSAASQWESINVYPSAGATPGNQAWLNLFTAANAYPSTNVSDYVNMHDIVPQAWNNLSAIIQKKDNAGNYPSIFGDMESGLLSIGDTVTTLVQLMSKRTQGIEYANITHTTFGSADFSSNWGYFSWTETTDAQGYTTKTNPVWNVWPDFTDSNPISASNPSYKYKVIPTVLDQLGNLIQATHIDQYHDALAVTPVPLLPGVPKEWSPVNPDLETFLALLKKLIG